VLTTDTSLGSFRVTFDNVTFTSNENRNSARIGLHDQPVGSRVGDGNAIIFDIIAGQSGQLLVTDSGTTNKTGVGNQFATGQSISIEYDGATARLLLDGMVVEETSFSATADFTPVFKIFDDSGASASETLEIGQVTVEEL